MSATLRCLTRSTDDPARFDVYWACGKRTQGLIHLHMEHPVADPGVAAELWVFAYLLQDQEVCGTDRTGKSLQLVCSVGAIKKLAAGHSAKAHLAPYATFLRTRFAEAGIKISKDAALFDPNRYRQQETHVTCTGPLDPMARIPGLGVVGISFHALARFGQRNCASSPSAAWRGLCAVLARPGGCLLSSGTEKPSLIGRTTLIYRTASGWRLVIVREGDRHRLVTATFGGSPGRSNGRPGTSVLSQAGHPAGR